MEVFYRRSKSIKRRLNYITERKAKEAEASMREIARAAREAHRRSAHLEAPPDTTQGTFYFIAL